MSDSSILSEYPFDCPKSSDVPETPTIKTNQNKLRRKYVIIMQANLKV